jgi:hypothetical protein
LLFLSVLGKSVVSGGSPNPGIKYFHYLILEKHKQLSWIITAQNSSSTLDCTSLLVITLSTLFWRQILNLKLLKKAKNK